MFVFVVGVYWVYDGDNSVMLKLLLLLLYCIMCGYNGKLVYLKGKIYGVRRYWKFFGKIYVGELFYEVFDLYIEVFELWC